MAEPLERLLAEHVVRARFEDLGDGVIDVTQLFILDTLGVAIAGAKAPGCKAIVDYVAAQGGAQESMLWGYRTRVPAEQAALVNGVFAHALDFDDTYVPGGLHTNAVIVPAAISVTEKRRRISGRDFVTAIALGVDLACRLSLAARDGLKLGWWPTGLFSTFGATAAVARLMGMDIEQTQHALGITYSQLAGNRQPMLDGSLTKRLQCGMASRAAVTSCSLAQRGITGAQHFLTGRFGLFALYANGIYNPEVVMEDLGVRFLGADLRCKMFPCCSGGEGAVAAALWLARDERLSLEDIAEIRVLVPPEVVEQIGAHLEVTNNLQVRAQFSLPYLVAASISKRKLTLDEIQEDTIRNNADVLELAKKVSVVSGEVLEARNAELPATVEILSKDGQRFSHTVHTVDGEFTNPDRRNLCLDKFVSCLRYAGGKTLAASGETLIETTLRLGQPGSVDPWISALAAVSV